ncbi:MAG: GNAT family N-acetyltransferase [Actinobacteria bacterium]|nr:GNAT family N-acetyltransferase [Actinomycetota bacterium]
MTNTMSSVSLPKDFSARPATADDVDTVVGLVAACDIAEYGVPDVDAEDVQAAWATPGFSLGKDNLIVEGKAGDPVGYLEILWGRVEAVVHPNRRGLGIGAYLLARAEQRALEQAPSGEAEVGLSQVISTTDPAAMRLLADAGYLSGKIIWRMTVALDEDFPPVWPDGVLPGVFEPGDELAVHALVEETFGDNANHERQPFEEWKAFMMERETFDPNLWIVARANREIVGVVLCPNYPDEGWIRQLSVKRSWRGRGLGMALLRQAFMEFRRRGRKTASLTVDSYNRTGARGLYERAGMSPEREYVTYTRRLRP